jgi:Fic family protein
VPKNRSYEKSHPWITFALDLRRLPSAFWTNLGEVQSKCRHVAQTLLPPDVSQELYEIYLAKGAHATTAIEGNTLSEEQVLDVARGHGSLPASQQYAEREVGNVVRACNEIARRVFQRRDDDITVARICEFNRWVLDGLPLDGTITPGAIRRYSVGVANYRGAPPEDCEHLLDRLCRWLAEGFAPPSEELKTAFAVIKATIAHLYLAWIHPFADGNGRTARLLEFAILHSAGVPDVSAHLLSNHYNLTRAEYYRQLDVASKSGGDVSHFLQYAVAGFRDGLAEQIERITRHQYAATWKEHVFDVIPHAGKTRERQRRIALALWGRERIPEEQIRYLTPQLAEAYAGLSDRAIRRDLVALEESRLIVRLADGSIRIEFRPLAERMPRQAGER